MTDRHLYLVIKLRVVPSGAKSNLLSTGALLQLSCDMLVHVMYFTRLLAILQSSTLVCFAIFVYM